MKLLLNVQNVLFKMIFWTLWPNLMPLFKQARICFVLTRLDTSVLNVFVTKEKTANIVLRSSSSFTKAWKSCFFLNIIQKNGWNKPPLTSLAYSLENSDYKCVGLATLKFRLTWKVDMIGRKMRTMTYPNLNVNATTISEHKMNIDFD